MSFKSFGSNRILCISTMATVTWVCTLNEIHQTVQLNVKLKRQILHSPLKTKILWH